MLDQAANAQRQRRPLCLTSLSITCYGDPTKQLDVSERGSGLCTDSISESNPLYQFRNRDPFLDFPTFSWHIISFVRYFIDCQ